MPQELLQINSRNPITRILLILFLILALVWSFFAVRWYLGNILAEYFNTADNNIDLAQTASSLAPKDPLTHWRLGQIYQQKLPVDQVSAAIGEFQKAVDLSPNDYRFWLALGTAQGQAGDLANSEFAFRKAVSLAPTYAYPRWYLGNLLLRQARYGEAFPELLTASDADTELRPQLFNLVWAVYDTDLQSLQNALGQNPTLEAECARYLVEQKNFDIGLRLWNSIGARDKNANKETGNAIIGSLVSLRRYRDAANIYNELIPNDSYRAEVGKVLDGGFEENLSAGTTVFGWQVGTTEQVQIGIDPGKGHSGSRSLRLVFQVRSRLEGINASQTVILAPDTEYELECYVSTQRLESGSTPFIQVIDATDNSVLGGSSQTRNGTNDWSQVSFTFKTKPKSEAVIIKILRASCDDDNTALCPIFGAVWYDDFSFKRRG